MDEEFNEEMLNEDTSLDDVIEEVLSDDGEEKEQPNLRAALVEKNRKLKEKQRRIEELEAKLKEFQPEEGISLKELKQELENLKAELNRAKAEKEVNEVIARLEAKYPDFNKEEVIAEALRWKGGAVTPQDLEIVYKALKYEKEVEAKKYATEGSSFGRVEERRKTAKDFDSIIEDWLAKQNKK